MTDHERADAINSYWRERGYACQAAPRECYYDGANGHAYAYQAVRSDLVWGLPPGYRSELAMPLRAVKR